MLWPASWRRSPPTIRRLDDAWAPACAAIHGSAFARPWSRDEVEQLISQREVLSDAAMTGKGKTLVGFVMSRIAPPEAEILTIAVDLGQRKRGIGRTLLSHHLSRLAASGINCVFLEVDEGNVPALKLYKGLGFEKVGQRPGYYAMKDGTRATALVLRADID